MAYYDVEWEFDSADEAAAFAIKVASGRTEKDKPITVSIIGVMPEEEEEDE